jgi:hypothetical protein
MGDKKSASLEMAILAGVKRGDFGILRNEGGGFVFEKSEEKNRSERREDAKGTHAEESQQKCRKSRGEWRTPK